MDMAQRFTTAQARELMREHEALQRTLEELTKLPERYREEAESAVRLLSAQDALSDAVVGYLEGEPRGTERTAETERLISVLYRYRKTRPYAEEAKRLQGQWGKPVRAAMQTLEPETGGLLRRLAAARGREAAAEAYRYLSEQASGAYGSVIRSCEAAVQRIDRSSADECWNDFIADRAVYGALLTELAPEALRDAAPARPFAETLRKLQTLEGGFADCRAAVDAERERVKKLAGRQVITEALEQLKEIPVEEINRVRSGIRVKTLRDNGFATAADVYAASVSQLAAVSGISEEAARSARDAAYELALQARANTRLRLNADERTEEAAGIVSALGGYRRKKAALEELQTTAGTLPQAVEQARAALERAGGGVNWLFLSEEARAAIRDARQEGERLAAGEAAQAAQRHFDTILRTPENDEEEWRAFAGNSAPYYAALEEVVPDILGGDGVYGLPEALADEIRDEAVFPDGLTCTLRRYQEWGVKYILHQGRVLLGDEMGLGKTVQAIAAMVSLRNTGATHFMVVCPASVLSNWCREIEKHSRLRAIKVHGEDREASLEAWLRKGGVAVTTYETTAYLELADDCRFSMLVVDEAHYIKNPQAKRTVNVKRLCAHADRLLFMTGTPLENRVDEMIGLIRILQPELAAKLKAMAFMSAAQSFREAAAPVYYRRRREDVLTELPEKVESAEWSRLSEEEKRVYKQTLKGKNYAAVRRVSWNVGDLKDSSKAGRLVELVEEAAEEERKIIVFSFFLDTIRDVGAMLGDRCFGPINGSVPPQQRQEIIDAFDSAPPGAVLLAQIQSGGTGLNIQAASVVILCEPQFKPSVEDQAISRAYRMGQARNVLVYRLLCEDTVDERIMELLDEKRDVFDAFADTSAAAEQSAELDDKTFGQIIEEEIERIRAEETAAGEAEPETGPEPDPMENY